MIIIKKNFALVSPFMTQANVVPFSNLINIVKILSEYTKIIMVYKEGIAYTNIYEIEGNVHFVLIEHKARKSPIKRIVNYFIDELKISYHIIKDHKQFSGWIYYIGDIHVIPILISKILRKKTFLVIGGSIEKLLVYNKDLFSVLIKILKKISLSLSDRLIVYSENIINEWSLENYKYKTYIAYEHYINIDKFNITKRYMERKNCIGYIGRLSKEKGILNFIESIPLILKGMPSLSFIIGGDGKLRNYIEEYIEKTKVNKNVSFVGWIPHKELPKYLNQLKLLVLPSYTEGLPNIMLEAMACGTPVLVTGVGAITDIIEDNKTGFILKDNSSEYISQAIQNIFTCHNQLSKVSKNSRDLIERKFTYEKTVDKWRIILHGSNQK